MVLFNVWRSLDAGRKRSRTGMCAIAIVILSLLPMLPAEAQTKSSFSKLVDAVKSIELRSERRSSSRKSRLEQRRKQQARQKTRQKRARFWQEQQARKQEIRKRAQRQQKVRAEQQRKKQAVKSQALTQQRLEKLRKTQVTQKRKRELEARQKQARKALAQRQQVLERKLRQQQSRSAKQNRKPVVQRQFSARQSAAWSPGYQRDATQSSPGCRVSGKTSGLHPSLRSRLCTMSRQLGPVTVVSGCRNGGTNASPRSYHRRAAGCKAADVRIAGTGGRRILNYWRKAGGGTGSYCGRSFVHVDVGPTRSWVHGCGRRS